MLNLDRRDYNATVNCEGDNYVGEFWMLINNRTLNIFKNISCKFDNVPSNTAYITGIVYTYETANKQNEPSMCPTSVTVADYTCNCNQTQSLLKSGVIIQNSTSPLHFVLCLLYMYIIWFI